MRNRITMNSKSLQAQFPKVYRELFSKCPIVVSAPGHFWWSGEYVTHYGGPVMAQKLPLRTYVGIEPSQSGKISLERYQNFDPRKGFFVSKNLEFEKLTKLINFLSSRFESTEGLDKKSFKVHVLSEVPSTGGLGQSGSFSTALAGAVLVYCEGVNIEKIHSFQNKSAEGLNKDLFFKEIFKLAWKIQLIFNPAASGPGMLVSLIFSNSPVIHFLGKRSLSSGKAKDFPVVRDDQFELVNQIDFWGLRLTEMLRDIDSISWPINLALIYSGKPIGVEFKPTYEVKDAFLGLDRIRKEIKNCFENIEDKNTFLQEHLSESKLFGQVFAGIFTFLSLQIIKSLGEVFEKGSEISLWRLNQAMNNYQKVLGLVYATTEKIDYICREVNNFFYESGEWIGGSAKVSVGFGGDILLVIPKQFSQKVVSSLFHSLRKKIGPDFSLDYASWIDGFEEEGMRVEQHLAEGMYSKFISEGSISLKNFTKEGIIQIEITSLEGFEKEKSKIDLLLDAIENDIYVKGEKLTSKEIPSSSATVEILSILLDNLGKSISNSQLPESSYARDRNEIQSKIVSPLVKAIKTKTKKSLPLKISGGLVEFKIKLDPSDLDIRILNKVF